MLDPQVTHLLETAINTSCKLAIMLRFVEQRGLTATAPELAARICRDLWSVQQALDELVEDGLILRRDKVYLCTACSELRSTLHLLQEVYLHPIQRGELQRLLSELESYAPYRKELPQRFFTSRVA